MLSVMEGRLQKVKKRKKGTKARRESRPKVGLEVILKMRRGQKKMGETEGKWRGC